MNQQQGKSTPLRNQQFAQLVKCLYQKSGIKRRNQLINGQYNDYVLFHLSLPPGVYIASYWLRLV